jgi:hypothetical protein
MAIVNPYPGIDAFCSTHLQQNITVNVMAAADKNSYTGKLIQIFPDCLQIEQSHRVVYITKQSIAAIYEAPNPTVTQRPLP